VLLWATATWWLPMLAILAAWQHAAKRLNRPYSVLYWGAVFPLSLHSPPGANASPALSILDTSLLCIHRAGCLAVFASIVHTLAIGARDAAHYRP
jgi:tellurite resistance protein TehA-like permease